jgi:murein DD-endopeptidase MepM/ murein hydrolase activator NlpD
VPVPRSENSAPTPRPSPFHFATFTRPEPEEPAARTSRRRSAGQFDWPIEGRTIIGYGVRASGERNDGINIAADMGEPVRAAADGVVTYTGTIKSYGKLVLISHEGGYVTTYAHNSQIRVKRGERVRRGHIIALAGASGNVSSPQLHFEIRHNGDPVDPRKLLVASN